MNSVKNFHKVMEENIPSPTGIDEGQLSCWGFLKLKLLPWRRRRRRRFYNTTKLQSKMGKRGCVFKYDPLSYAQNFDEGLEEYDEESSHLGFSARYATPLSKPLQDK